MKITSVTVHKLLPLCPQRIDLDGPGTVSVIVGPNGSGKSRLIAYMTRALAALGVNGHSSYDMPIGEVDLTVEIDFSDELEEIRVSARDLLHDIGDQSLTWNGKVEIRLRQPDSQSGSSTEIVPEGIDEPEWLIWHDAIRSTHKPRIAMIDGNRTYSRMASLGEINRARAEDFRNVNDGWSRNWSTASSDNAFVQWFTLLYSMESDELARANAQRIEGGDATIRDPFQILNAAIGRVMKGVRIKGSGVNKELQFGRKDYSVIFQELSAGEREVVFILSLAEILAIQNGVLIIDEPELHLHPLLLRKLLNEVAVNASDLQVIVASHSYEAAEVALNQGRLFTFRTSTEGTVIEMVEPGSAYQRLVTILGTPGLGLSSTLFVAVEGAADSHRALARFDTNIVSDERVVFLRAGSGKTQVKSLINSLSDLASSRGEPLQIIGIVDGDYSSMGGEKVINGVLSIGVNEVENLYLEPAWLDSYVRDRCLGLEWDGAEVEVRRLSKENAGNWVFQYASEHHRKKWMKLRCVPELDDLKPKLESLTWEQLVSNDHQLQTAMSGIRPEPSSDIVEAIRIYAGLIEGPDIWKHCKGKLILTGIARRLRFSGDRTKLEIELDRYRAKNTELELKEWERVQQFLDSQLMQLFTPRNTPDPRALPDTSARQ